MGFNLGKVVKGAGALTGIGLLSKYLKPNQTTQDQVPLETPEQRAARIKLLGFANTGTFGNFTAGQDQNLGYGDYGATGTEQTGLSELEKLLASGTPEGFTKGNAALTDILNPDPNFIQSQFDPFKAQTQRQIEESNTNLTRGAGFAGNLYSTDTIRGLGDIQARGNETLTSKLAELTNQAMERRLRAVPLAFQGAQGQEDINQGRIAASQQYGGLTRQLNDARIKARDAEILRRRTELQLPIQAASNVAGQNANFGVPSVTTQTPSFLMDLLKLGVQGGSTYLGAKAGARN
jgi:hypothetical protein